MAEMLRVKAPKPTDTVIYEGKRYAADHDGVALIPDDGALRQAAGADVLPRASVSLSHLDLPELTCLDCGRRKLAMMGTVCGWCGGDCG